MLAKDTNGKTPGGILELSGTLTYKKTAIPKQLYISLGLLNVLKLLLHSGSASHRTENGLEQRWRQWSGQGPWSGPRATASALKREADNNLWDDGK